MNAIAGFAVAAGLLIAPPAAAQSATAERPILLLAQIRSQRVDPTLAPEMRPLQTMKEVEAFLKAHNIPYARGRMQLDTRKADRRLSENIGKLPPGEIFVVNQEPNATIFSQVIKALSDEEAERVENW